MLMKTRLAGVGPIVLLAILSVLVFWPGVSGDFIFDDYPNIVSNPRVHAEHLDLASIDRAARGYEPGAIGRPLATVSFALNYLAAGKAPWAYKVTNVLLHALNALLVFGLLNFLLDRTRASPFPARATAWFAACLWALHPLQVSTVLYVVQRMELLALTFILGGLWIYAAGRQRQLEEGPGGWPLLVLSGVVAAAGLLCKETAALFPIFCLGLELALFRFGARRALDARLIKSAYGAGLALAAVLYFALVVPRYLAPHAFDGRPFTVYERLYSQLRILPMYLGQILWPNPAHMPFYYDGDPKSTGLASPLSTLAGGCLILVLLGAAFALRRRAPLFALGTLWFFGCHLLTSNVFNLELAFEHRNYFAVLGVILAVIGLLGMCPPLTRSRFPALFATLAVIMLGFACLLRAATWGDPVNLATTLVQLAPQSARASSDLATVYVGISHSDPGSRYFQLAEQEFERGAKLPSASALPEQGLILMRATTGLLVEARWWDSLIDKVANTPITPQQGMAVTGLLDQRYAGIALDDTRLAQAMAALFRRSTQPAFRHAQYGDYALHYLHQPALADQQFALAVDAAKADPDYVRRIHAILADEGSSRQAAVVASRAQALGIDATRPPATQP